jgi:hypothetical protein
MNANYIESKFAAIGARLKVREIPTRTVSLPIWMRRNVAQPDYAVDLRRPLSRCRSGTGSS